MADNSRVKMHFVTSAADLLGCPLDDRPEIALAGRSNAGKSSLINALADNKAMAKVSSAPGKTRLLNFFNVGESYRIVDMPGYGFAARSGDEQRTWHEMVESYLSSRGQLAGLILVMDIRRDWSDDEETLVEWVTRRDLPVAIAATKVDKLAKSEIAKRYEKLGRAARMNDVFLTSALKKQGFSELEKFIYQNWVKPVL